MWDVRFDLHVDLSNEVLIKAVARAEALAQIVRGIPLPPAVYDRIDRLNISRAVRGTTGIEGADLSEEEVARVLTTDHAVLGQARAREEREARNAGAVMALVESTLRANPEAPLTEDLIREIHRLTTEGIDYPHNSPGTYRSHAVHALDYVPPRTEDEVRALMAEFVRWLNSGQVVSWPPIIRAIAAHFYFISIHPFGDGNGRTARAIESYLLYQGKINVVGFYSLSNFYYRNRTEYVEMLDYVRFQSGGTLTPFLNFAIAGLVEELEQVREEVLHALTQIVYYDYARSIVAGLRLRSGVAERVSVFLAHLHDTVAVSELKSGQHFLGAMYKGLSTKTLDRDLQLLEKHQLILRENGSVRINLDVMQQFTR
jgi:Fic family protein